MIVSINDFLNIRDVSKDLVTFVTNENAVIGDFVSLPSHLCRNYKGTVHNNFTQDSLYFFSRTYIMIVDHLLSYHVIYLHSFL